MRSRLDEQLALLNKEMIEMGALCEEAIALASKALTTGEVSLSKKVVAISSDIDHMESDIESLCLKLILHQQPVARDLRQISATLKMITDMERIGDQAEDIAEIVNYLKGKTASEAVHIRDMSAETITMVTDSIDAYVKKDIELAKAVIRHDDKVDEYFDMIKKNLIKMITENAENGEFAIDLLMIAKYIERIGDHATNIAEWVIFSITGQHED